MTDFSDPKVQELYKQEVRKRMEAPFFMSLEQAQNLVAVLMAGERKTDEEKEQE